MEEIVTKLIEKRKIDGVYTKKIIEKVEIKETGDSNFLSGELIDRIQLDGINSELSKTSRYELGERLWHDGG